MLKEKENPNDEREKMILKGKISMTIGGGPNVKVNLNDEEENLIDEGGNPNDEGRESR